MKLTKEPVAAPLANYLWGSSADDVEASVALSYDGGVLKALFSVGESELRRMVGEPNGPVWTDSCVEVFAMGPSRDWYANFEFSASGAFLACKGAGRKDRERFSESQRALISATPRILENNNRWNRWELEAEIDLVGLGLLDEGDSFFTFNCYKCGDGLIKPHFLSLFPIATETPDFHRPEFFGRAEI